MENRLDDRLLPSYIYQCLLTFGNTVINRHLYKKLGEDNILVDLKSHGLNCRIVQCKEIYNVHDIHTRFRDQSSVIIELIEERGLDYGKTKHGR